MKLRIFHGPANIAGIGRHLADWQREQGHIADSFSFDDSPIVDAAHFDLKLGEFGPLTVHLLRCTLFLFCLVRYKIFHFYAGATLLGRNLDLPILRLFGKKIVMTYCGSEARLIEVEARRNPYWKLLTFSLDHPRFDPRKRRMMRWHRLWVHKVIAPRNIHASATTVFPEKAVIKDLWIHNAIKIDRRPLNYRPEGPPLIVHAPSELGIKGTRYVEEAIRELERAGVRLRYRRIENLAHTEMLRVLRDEADIVIDQLLLGGFGTLAVEAMHAGKPVIGYLIEAVKREHFPDCPIVNATIDDLKDKLAALIDRPAERARIGREGHAYVEHHFDRESINRSLLKLYESL